MEPTLKYWGYKKVLKEATHSIHVDFSHAVFVASRAKKHHQKHQKSIGSCIEYHPVWDLSIQEVSSRYAF